MKKLFVVLLMGAVLLGSAQGILFAEAAAFTEPVTITFWHARGSSVDAQWLEKSINEFNAPNNLGITVEGFYQGYFSDVQAKTLAAIAAGDPPTLAEISCTAIPLLATQDLLVDMTPYVNRDGFDMNNIVEAVSDYIYYNGQIVTMPYTRGTAIMYYNKDMYAEVGLDRAPTTLEELNHYAKLIYENSNGAVQGIGYTIEANYYQHYLVQSLNGVGILDADGTGASCLEDGSLLRFLTDWYEWTEEGWCAIPALSSASSVVQEDFNNKSLAAFVSSSNRATTILNNAKANGIDLGMSYTVGYGGYSAPIGGGSLGIINRDNSDLEIAAAWEFIKFLMTDAQVAGNHVASGVLPVTYSSIETDIIQDCWAENEGYRISYEQLDFASEIAFSPHVSEWSSIVKSAMSQLIQGRNITPEEVVENLKAEAAMVF